MRRRWVLFFIGLLPVVAVWAVTNPMFASPDENLHMVRAQSIARGDFSNPFTTDGLPVDSIECFKFLPETTPVCQDLTWGDDGTPRTVPTDGYPPLFHGIAALPAVFTSGLAGAYVMRLWLAMVVVAIVAWAGVFVTRPGSGPWPLVGFAVALTPMAVFTMATVNPSGMALSSAMLFVAAVLSLRAPVERGWPVAAAIAAGAGGLALSRRDGLLWLAILALVLLPLVHGAAVRDWIAATPRRTRLWIGAPIGLVVVAALASAPPTISRFFGNWRDGQGTDMWEAGRYVRTYIYQAVGVFGWLDSPIGEETFLVAMIVAGSVVVLGLAGSQRRLVVSTALAVAALVVTPMAFGVVRFPYLQGRYLLPIWVGVLLVAGASAATAGAGDGLTRRASRLLLSVWLGVHVIGAMQNLRRYAVGRSGSWNFVSNAQWHPDTMSNLAAVLCFVVAFTIAGAAFAALLRAGQRDLADSDLFGETAGHPIEDRPADHQARE